MNVHATPPVQVLWEDNSCLVVLKPASLLTQAPLGIDSLEYRIRQLLRERANGQQDKFYLGVPHRLDRPVSGVIVFARNVRAARRISEQFEARTVDKTYWALVPGEPNPAAGTWTDYLQKIEGEPRTAVVAADDPQGRIAILHYQTKRTLPAPDSLAAAGIERCSLLEIQLETGRTHQIRAQTSAHGHPLVGDALYGSNCDFGPPSSDERQRLIGLHARSLAFDHPVTKERLSFTAPLPEYWQAWGIVD